jgi:hypothetical protein
MKMDVQVQRLRLEFAQRHNRLPLMQATRINLAEGLLSYDPKGLADMKKAIEEIRKRSLPDGGFALQPGSQYRPDATAWAVMALQLWGLPADLLRPARARIAAEQDGDGRIAIAPGHAQAFWPTSLAVFAWHGRPEFEEPRSRAVSFLLRTTGTHFKKEPENPTSHDTSLRGWPWTTDTHSWVEPTSLSIAALRIEGCGTHERVGEGVRLLMDRQLASGGWNYGNTKVFGTELEAMPESTGLALSALSGFVKKQDVSRSITHLKGSMDTLTTPFSLGWAILGLSAWGERPQNAGVLIDRCLNRQYRYGAYDTSLIALMLFCLKAEGGLIHAFS